MFRKIFLTILCLFVLSAPVYAVQKNWYVDTACGDNGDGTWDTTGGGCDDNGGGTDGAFNNLKTALESNGYSPSDKIWIRRTSTYDEGVAGDDADIAVTEDGSAILPVSFIGYPRAITPNTTITEGDWTNGSTTVDNIVGITCTRGAHVGRWATAPDGFDYLITKITDANTLIIDRPYAGSTVTDVDGKFAIKADEDYTEAAALEGGAVLIAWGADADELPIIDFNSESYYLDLYADIYIVLKNIHIMESVDQGSIHIQNNNKTFLEGILITHDADLNNALIYCYSAVLIANRIILEGSEEAGNSSEDCLFLNASTGHIIQNSAMYGCDNGISINGAKVKLLNTNICVEAVCAGDTFSSSNGLIEARDSKFDSTNGFLSIESHTSQDNELLKSVNHNKVVGAYKEWLRGVTIEKVAVTATSANEKLSDNVIELTPLTAATYQYKEIAWKAKVFESRKTYDAGTYNIKVWIYNDTGNTLNDTTFSDDILMRCRAEARSYGDATTEYVSMPWIYSDGAAMVDILDAANEDDWDYLQVDSVVVDLTGSKIYCEVLVSFYDAGADPILIDPQTSNP